MASPAAQQMFNSLSPAEQARVTASIAGNPNGLDDWYQNAAKAGDPRAFGAGGAGQSEDFRRFLDPGGEYNQQGQGAATLTGWAQQYYDEAASRAAGRPQFRSMRGEQGYFDKPTECPPGMGPSGPNESDPCTAKGYSEPAGGATEASTAATGAAGPSQSQLEMSMLYSPLRDLLANQGHMLRQFDSNPGDGKAGVQGGIMGGGGMWWSPTQSQPQTGGMELKPAAASGLTSSIPGQSGVYGGYNPGGGAVGPAQPGGTKQGTGPWSPANPYGGINPQPGPAQSGEGKQDLGSWTPASPYGGYNPNPTGTLTSMLTPLQNQAATSPLGNTLMPFQTQVRKKDPLANALGPAQQAGRWF